MASETTEETVWLFEQNPNNMLNFLSANGLKNDSTEQILGLIPYA
jgi:hypothetical protein